MRIVFNSSPLIFLSKLNYLNQVIALHHTYYIPRSVANEISAKSDASSQVIQSLIDSGDLQVRTSNLISLVNSLNQRLGLGESEAIALGIELNVDHILLDDSTARREAKRLGLSVRGTLSIIKVLIKEGKINLENLDSFYQELIGIDFRIKRALFEQIFSED